MSVSSRVGLRGAEIRLHNDDAKSQRGGGWLQAVNVPYVDELPQFTHGAIRPAGGSIPLSSHSSAASRRLKSP